MSTTVTVYAMHEIEKTINDKLQKKLEFIYHRMDKLNQKLIDIEKMLEGVLRIK